MSPALPTPSAPWTAPRRVLVVGVGGLGCPASLALAQAGVAHLTLMDADRVELSNLHRQPWHLPSRLGVPKVQSAAERLRSAFPELALHVVEGRLEAGNARALFEAHDLIIDATDGVGTKFLLSDAAVLTGRPLIYAGVLRFEGLAMRLHPGGPCLRCLFETPPTDVPTCAEAGVLGSMAGLMGGLQAHLALQPPSLPGVATLHVVDGLSLSFRRVRVRRRPDCEACGEGRVPVLRNPEEPTCQVPTSTSPTRSAP